jgi:cellulose synthase/poly-beta-1,6-N-acetylglucosamine synthase-like glycosyltransferase
MRQDYRGEIQHIFSFQDPDDPALPVVRALPARYPEAHITFLVNPLIRGLNGKSSNMVHGLEAARYETIVFGDSDTRVRPDFILKMVRPLQDERVGVTTCGQINIGGRDFWTRFFTFLQNCETDFNWAFLTWLGIDVGITGAAFAMRGKLIDKLGGLQRFGGSLLEDLSLGNQLRREKRRIVLGPFVECHVDRLNRAKSLEYAKRLAIGIRRHISLEMPAFLLMLSWYWILLVVALVLRDRALAGLCLGFLGLRTATGLFQRVVTGNRILLIDTVMPFLFDILGTFYLLLPYRRSYVTWRGIRYRVGAGGDIEEVVRSE